MGKPPPQNKKYPFILNGKKRGRPDGHLREKEKRTTTTRKEEGPSLSPEEKGSLATCDIMETCVRKRLSISAEKKRNGPVTRRGGHVSACSEKNLL